MKWWVKTIQNTVIYIIAISFALFININVLHTSFIPSGSMEPTIRTNNFVIGTRFDVKNIKRYDVITFWKGDKILIKRIIGVPGDHIKIHDGTLYINHQKIKEEYIKEQMITENLELDIPQNSVFVMGDNRNNSKDSRSFGTIPTNSVISHSRIVFFPFRFL